MAAVVRNRFYVAVALALAVLVFVGFARTYYLRPWFDVPPINVLLHLHSIAFSAWFALFIIQTRLIAAQNYRTHMQLGMAGVTRTAGVPARRDTAIASADAPRVRPMGMNSQQFVLVPLVGIAFFGGLLPPRSHFGGGRSFTNAS